MLRPWVIVAGMAVIAGGACGTGPDFSRVLGIIQNRDEPVGEVIVPSRWARGVEFTVLVTTIGGCFMEKGDTQVLVEGLHVTVTPHDLMEIVDLGAAPNVNCPGIEAIFRHTATVRVDERGAATVVFRGLRLPDRDTIEIVRTVDIF